ncbi:MAG: mitoguardin [bacterium]|nr:mitoguardin [bacterium]
MKTKLKELQLKRNDKLFISIALIGTIILIIFSVGLRVRTQQNKKEHENQSQLVSQSNSEDSSKEPSSSSSEKNSSTSTTTTSPSSSSSEETSTESSTATESSSSSSSEETSTKSTTTPNSSSTEIASQEDTTSPIVIDVNEFINKDNNYELDTNQIYQFDAEPFETELWGLDADRKEYGITIKDGSHSGYLLLTTKAIAEEIKDSKTVTFTVKIDTTSTTYIDPVRVISATPKQ